MSTKRPRDRWAHYTCYVVAAGLCAWGAQGYLANSYPPAATLWLLQLSGWAAAGGILASACMTPVQRLVRRFSASRARAVPFAAARRALGISAAFFAVSHAFIVFGRYLPIEAWLAAYKLPFMRAGLGAVAILSALWLTSFPVISKRLRVRRWKHLHRLVYFAQLLLFQHLFLAPFAPRDWTLALGAALVVVASTRLVPRARRT